MNDSDTISLSLWRYYNRAHVFFFFCSYIPQLSYSMIRSIAYYWWNIQKKSLCVSDRLWMLCWCWVGAKTEESLNRAHFKLIFNDDIQPYTVARKLGQSDFLLFFKYFFCKFYYFLQFVFISLISCDQHQASSAQQLQIHQHHHQHRSTWFRGVHQLV